MGLGKYWIIPIFQFATEERNNYSIFVNKKITLLLGALYGFILLHVNAGENIFWGNLQPVFQAGYLDNNYRIVYLLENETIIAVERIIEKDSGKEFLQFEAVGKRSFATIRMEVEGRHWVTLKTKTENISKTGIVTGKQIGRAHV